MLAEHLRTVIFVVGLLLLTVGIAQIYPPGAYIAAGVILLWTAIPPSARARKTS
jgi:hypothetical protein